MRGTRLEGRGRDGGGAGPEAGPGPGRRPEGRGRGSGRGGHCACVLARGWVAWVLQAPGIDLRWGRVDGAGSGICLGKGLKLRLRTSTHQVKESIGMGLAGEVGQITAS